MSAFEINKIVGALLCAALVVVGSRVLTNHLYGTLDHGAPHEDAGAPSGADAEAPEPLADGAEAAAEDEAEAIAPALSLGALMATASAEAGAKGAKKCAACHSFDEGGANKVGPNLWDVIERPVGAVAGFGYSDALAGLGGTWSFERLDAFLAKPAEYVPGTKMSFSGIKDPAARADLLAFLRSLSAAPASLPQE